MRGLVLLLGAFTAALLSLAPVRAAPPVLRAALQLSGTVNWEADTIRHYGLDTSNGFSLEVIDVAGAPAAQIALLAGDVDMIVPDWLWVARERVAGRDFVFIPYSRAVGGLMVPADSPAKTLADLKGGKIGVAGSPIDKSWLILRAYAQKVEGIDLSATTEQLFGAPPLIYKAALDGELQGALNFWNFGARMQAAGMRTLVSVEQAAQALGLDPETPLLGYVVRGPVLKASPRLGEAIAGGVDVRHADRDMAVGAAYLVLLLLVPIVRQLEDRRARLVAIADEEPAILRKRFVYGRRRVVQRRLRERPAKGPRAHRCSEQVPCRHGRFERIARHQRCPRQRDVDAEIRPPVRSDEKRAVHGLVVGHVLVRPRPRCFAGPQILRRPRLRPIALEEHPHVVVAERAVGRQGQRPFRAAPVVHAYGPLVDDTVLRVADRDDDGRIGAEKPDAIGRVLTQNRLQMHFLSKPVDAAVGEHRPAQQGY